MYRGRRDFEKHFTEWQHINGMKALGIPNTKDFYEITKIEDARTLWENIKVRSVRCFIAQPCCVERLC